MTISSIRRFALLATGTAVALSAAVVVDAGPAGAATSAAPGAYVAFSAQSRVVDTRTGAGGNHKGALRAGRTITVRVAGVGRVPRSGVRSVLVTVTAMQPTGTGGLVLYGGLRPHTTNLRFTAHQTPVTNTAIVPLSSTGRMRIANTATSGSVQVAVDVSGYYRSGTPSSSNPGIFHVLGTARRAVSLRLQGGASVTTAIGGRAGVPSSAGAAAVTLTVSGATRSGTILAHRPDEPKQNLPLVRFSARRPVSSFAVLRLSGGRATFVNTGARTVRLTVDAAGWYTIGFAQTARAFQTLVQTRVANTAIAARSTVTLSIAGRGGVPLRGVSAVLVTLHAVNPGRTGGLQAWRPGTTRPRSTTVLQFQRGRSASNVALVPVSSTGRIALHNTAGGRTGLAVDVDGYVPGTTLSPPAASNSRYLSDLTGTLSADQTRMRAHGCAEARARSRFVLLDLGAQSVTGRLAGNPGVSLAKTASTVRYTYSELETLLGQYFSGYVSCSGGVGAEIAVGTNSSGDWDPTSSTYYAPGARGADWANFIDALAAAAPAGITVAGADDIEPTNVIFPATVSQVQTWKSSYLANTTAEFIFNGSADGCPVTWTKGRSCNSGWTERQLYGLAAGPRTRALPQVYFGAMATQWAMIDATGGGRIRFVGALEQPTVSGGLSSAQSWVALSRAVASVTTTAVPRRVIKLLG